MKLYVSFGFLQMKVWDVQERKCVAVLMGHTGSVKSMSSHPTNPGWFKIFTIFRVWLDQLLIVSVCVSLSFD